VFVADVVLDAGGGQLAQDADVGGGEVFGFGGEVAQDAEEFAQVAFRAGLEDCGVLAHVLWQGVRRRLRGGIDTPLHAA